MAKPVTDDWRALVAVTTCDRDLYLRRCLPRLALASASDPRLSVLVSLDGDDPATRSFCEAWAVPLLHSDVREGVGLSKNRVLEAFPEFDYYFFIEDDVEILDGTIFASHVEMSRAASLHHMSLFERSGVRSPISESHVVGRKVVHARYGGAQFNFFTAEGLRVVGGWHPLFARYRRWGHTEHSYRFPRNGLAPEPFNVAVELSDSCIVHRPPSITRIASTSLDPDQISTPERELMDLQLKHIEVQTFTAYHFNGAALRPLDRLAAATDTGPYALLSGGERRRARSDYLVWRSERRHSATGRLASLAAGAALAPTSVAVKHAIKTRLARP